MFRDFYTRACADAPPGPNPYAPSLARWGFAFLRRVFQSGHVLMFDVDTLDRLFDRIRTHAIASPPPTLTPGINLIGFAFGEFGLGENLRALARACEAARHPVRRERHRYPPQYATGRPPHDVASGRGRPAHASR